MSEAEIHDITKTSGKKLKESSESAHHPSNTMDTASFNMRQYRISWCIKGDNTPEYADYLGYLDFWKLFPDFPSGRSLEAVYQDVVTESSKQ